MSEIRKTPLCVFCLSPPFSIRIFKHPSETLPSRRPSTRGWRRGGCSLPSVRPRFKYLNRRASNSLPKYLAESLTNHGRKILNLKHVLNIIQQVWKSPNHKQISSSNSSSTIMEEKRKTSNEIPSPVLLRRRLSAPETIMRKHMLAQQRSDSQDNEILHYSNNSRNNNYYYHQWRNDMTIGSDPNLNRKRDSNLMRKSTLLKRLWSNSKSLTGSRFSGSFSEWQHSFGKLASNSLTSIHSSPEHYHNKSPTKRNIYDSMKTSQQHKRESNKKFESPKHQLYDNNNYNTTSSSKNTNSPYNSNFDCYRSSLTCSSTIPDDSDNKISVSNSKTSTDIDSNYTILSDNSDSAYTNSKSNYSSIINNNNDDLTSEDISKNIVEESEHCNKDGNLIIKRTNNIQTDNSNNKDFNESSTQTLETTNLNVISNVHLSQPTLDLIFNKVMQDVENNIGNNLKIVNESSNKIIKVQQLPSFYLKNKEDINNEPNNKQIIKYMISNVGTGSIYTKPNEIPQLIVPRYSALPRTTSMEVNMSSGNSTDKESDTISLVDSLEDQTSPRIDYEDKSAIGELSPLLLPDNSKKNNNLIREPAKFFIPIEINNQKDYNAVSDHLPDKVRKKLAKRQQKREEKIQQNKKKIHSPKSDSNYVSASDNGNQLNYIINNSPSELNLSVDNNLTEINLNNTKSKKKFKPFLPNIETFRKMKSDKKNDNKVKEQKCNKFINKRKSMISEERIKETSNNSNNNNNNNPKKLKNKIPEKLSPLYTTKNEYVCTDGPRRIYHKTEFNSNLNKRIEIIEIMECIDNNRTTEKEKLHNHLMNSSKNKSKIPILVHQRLPKIDSSSSSNRLKEPTYLDENSQSINNSKLDQLIANILIDTLNNPDGLENVVTTENNKFISKNINESRPVDIQTHLKNNNSRYQQKFEVIPEELSVQSSLDESQKNSNENIVKDNIETNRNIIGNINKHSINSNCYKGKAAVEGVKDENFTTIPKGWITFYMLHKNEESPESTSDEGTKLDYDRAKSNNNNNNNNNKEEHNTNNLIQSHQQDNIYNIINKEKSLSETNDNFSSNSDKRINKKILPSPITNGRYKKYNYPRKQRYRYNNNGSNENSKCSSEWSVTVSGSNNYGQTAPDLEMRFKFPNFNKTNNISNPSDSGLGEDNHERGIQFPKLNPRVYSTNPSTNNKHKIPEKENSYQRQCLPDITRHTLVKKPKRSDSSVMYKGMSSRIEPRQTRTSTSRYKLNHPKLDYQMPESPTDSLHLFDERHYAELLKRFPEILSITGNAISSERKTKVPTMSERDLTRNYFENTS